MCPPHQQRTVGAPNGEGINDVYNGAFLPALLGMYVWL